MEEMTVREALDGAIRSDAEDLRDRFYAAAREVLGLSCDRCVCRTTIEAMAQEAEKLVTEAPRTDMALALLKQQSFLVALTLVAKDLQRSAPHPSARH